MATTLKAGIIIQINEKDVMLTPKDAAGDLKKTGAHYKLDEPVYCGTAADLATFLTAQFGVGGLPDPTTFPAPLDSVYAKLTNLGLTVSDFQVTVPPSVGADDKPIAKRKAVSFDLGLLCAWKAGEEVALVGSLKFKGLFIHVAKDDAN
ncbi:MAG: hypothetical protein V4550_10625 [Gemmatimonadota bacterium]